MRPRDMESDVTNMRLADQALKTRDTKIESRNVDVFYGDNHAIKDVRR